MQKKLNTCYLQNAEFPFDLGVVSSNIPSIIRDTHREILSEVFESSAFAFAYSFGKSRLTRYWLLEVFIGNGYNIITRTILRCYFFKAGRVSRPSPSRPTQDLPAHRGKQNFLALAGPRRAHPARADFYSWAGGRKIDGTGRARPPHLDFRATLGPT